MTILKNISLNNEYTFVDYLKSHILKLFTRLPHSKFQPSISTKKIILKGIEISIGGSIIIPMLIRILAITISITTKGK